MTSLRATSWFAASLVLLLWSAPLRADDAPGPPSATDIREAKERFSRGLHLLDNGDYGSALVELERVQQVAPARVVQYHLARAYSGMGKPVEAMETIDELLAAQGPLKADIESKARALKEEEMRKIGKLAVGVNVPAGIEVDGEHEGDAPLKAPVEVAAGNHIVCVSAAGHVPACQATSVAAKGSAELIFELQPGEGSPAVVAVHSALPGGEVFLDDALVARTPFPGKVKVMPGKHSIEIRRPGYMTVRHELTLVPGQNTAVAFDPDEDSQAADAAHGQLRLKLEPDEVEVTLDGRSRGAYKGAFDVPAGPHVVKMEAKDFESMERVMEVPAGGEAVVKAALRPTPKIRDAYVSSARSRRSWSYVSMAGGVVVAGFGTGLAVWANGKLPAARDGLTLAQKDAQPGGVCDPASGLNPTKARTCQLQISNAQSDIDKYTNYRTYGIVGAAAGVALLGVGIVLLVTGSDPGQYDRDDDTLASRPLVPVFVAGPDGAAFGLQGRF